MAARFRVDNVLRVTSDPETVTVRVCEKLRGEVLIDLPRDEARWLLASLLDLRNAGALGEFD